MPHRLLVGQRIRFDIESTVSQLTGDATILTIPSEYSFTIHWPAPADPYEDTGGHFECLNDIYESNDETTFDATHAYETGLPTFAAVQINSRISSFVVSGSLVSPTWAKVTAKAVGILTVDGWSAGTPTNAQIFRIDGYVADLPRCQEMTESFEPDDLIHSLYRGDAGSEMDVKHRGWKYTCKLDYSRYADSDMLYGMKHQLAPAQKDQLVLIPRRDKPGRQFNVYWSDVIELTKQRLEGYRKPVFTFRSIRNVAGVVSLQPTTEYDGGL
jgi:hypothetical protein